MLNKIMQLNEKDKRILILGGITLGLTLIYLCLVQPINHYKKRLSQNIQYNQHLLLQMQQAKQLVSQQHVSHSHNTGSIATLLQQSFKVAKIKPTQVNITGQKASIKFNHVIFDDLAKWFVLLHTQYTIKVIHATVVKQPAAGIVEAQIMVVPAV